MNRQTDSIQTGRIAGWLLANVDHSDTRRAHTDDMAVLPLYREVAFRFISLSFVILLIPFIVANFISGHYTLLAIEVGLLAPLIFHCWRLINYNRPLFTPYVMMSAAFVTTGIAFIMGQGTNIYWVPAIVITCYFILDHAKATIFNVLYFAIAIPAALIVLPNNHVMSFMISLVMASGASYLFSLVVYQQEKHLQLQAVTDTLTQTFNRRYLMECMEQVITSCERYNKPASIIMLDIDHFKAINDTWGHSVGDNALIELARQLHFRLRKTDKLFRYGGEEFIILLEETDAAQALMLAEEICERIRSATIIDQQPVTVSCGVAEFRQESALVWLERCDEALYRAKRDGRDQAAPALADLARDGKAALTGAS